MSARIHAYRGRRPLLLLGLLLIGCGWVFGADPLGAPLAQLRAVLFYHSVAARLENTRVVGVSRDGEMHWLATVVFSYEVGGHRWQSRREAWLPREYARREQAEARIAELRADGELLAWFDPAQPALAVLDAGPPAWRAWRRAAAWLGCMLAGLLLMLRGLRRRRRWR